MAVMRRRKNSINRGRTGTRFIAFLMAFALTVTALPLYSATETAEAAEVETEEAESTGTGTTAAWESWEELYAVMVAKEEGDGLGRRSIDLKSLATWHENYSGYDTDAWEVLVGIMEGLDILDAETDYEKVYAIANWIGANITYSLSEGTNLTYFVLTDGYAVCGGYASLFCIMCAYAGVDAIEITYSGTQHAWNAVCVDGNWYWADLTSFTTVEDKMEAFLYGNDSAAVLIYDAYAEQAIFTGSDVCSLISNYSYYYYNSSCNGEHTWKQTGIPLVGFEYDCAPGLATYTCTECGCIYSELIESDTAHTYEAVTVEPTCTTKGYTAYVCSVCGKYYVEDYYTYKFDLVDAVGHTDDGIEVTMKEPTCTATGYAYTHCSYCGRVMQTITLAATGHDWDEGTVTVAAGAVSTGTMMYECLTCGATKRETIAATGAYLEDVEITLECDTYEYDGTFHYPEAIVKIDGKTVENTETATSSDSSTLTVTGDMYSVTYCNGSPYYTTPRDIPVVISGGTNGLLKGDVTVYFTIVKAPTTVTAVLDAESIEEGGTAQITALATCDTTGRELPCYYESSDTSVATVSSSGLVTGVSRGVAEITVYTSATLSDYAQGSTVITVTVTEPGKTDISGADITFTEPEAYFVYDGTAKEPELLVTLNGSGLEADTDYTVAYTDNVNAGTASMTLTGTGNYTGSVTVTFEIAKVPQEVTFAGTTEYTVGDVLNLTASSTGDGAVTVAYTDADGAEVTEDYMLANAGTYTAAATAPETDNYEAGSASVTVTVSEPQEPVNISGASVRVSPVEYTYDGTAKEPEVTVTLGGTTLAEGTDYAVSYSDNTDAGIATVTVTGTGSYTGSAETCFTINRAAQELSADNFSVTAGSTKTLSISGAAGTLSYESSNTSVVTVSADGTVTGMSAGEAIITVIAAETDNYEEGCIDITVTVTRRTQELSVSPGTVSLAVGETSALTVSGAETALTYLSSDETVALVSRTGVITAVSAGTAMITVEAEQTDVCESAAAEMTVTVGPAVQELAVSSPSVTLAAGKTSEITVSGAKTAVTYESSDETVATVSGSGVITAVSAGTATVTVTAEGTDSYAGASAQVEVTVTRNAQSISVGNPSPILAAGETSTVAVSGAETVLTYKSSDTSVATVSSMGTITAVSAGTATITVTAAQTGQYSAASATVDVTVYRNTQKISVTSANVGIYAGETSAIAVNGAETALSYKSSNTSVATVSSSGVITAVSAGTATITVTAEETGQYYGASATVAVTVKRNTQDITVASAGTIAAGKTSAISVSGAKTAVTYTSSNTSVATVSSTGVVTAVSAGTADITITAAQTGQYEKAAITVTVTVTRNTQSLSVSPSSVSLANGGSKTLSVSGAKTALSYASSNTSVATVNSSGKITAKGVGTATITVTAAQTGQYTKATATVKVTVVPKAPAISSVKNTTTGVKVTWGKVTGAAKYYVYRKVSGGSYEKVKTISSGSTVSWTDTTVSSGKTYYYKVYAYASTGKSAASSAKSVKYLASGKVSSLTNASDGITVKWGKVTGASGYYVYRKTASGSYKKVATVGKSTTSWTDTAVKSKNGTTYYYCVKAYSGSTTGSYTGKKTVRLTAVSLSSATNSASKTVTVKVSAKNAKATGYQIQYSTSSTFASGNKTVKITSASTLSKKITGLMKGKTYYARVRAYKTVDGTTYYSAWSSKKSVKVSK